MLIATLRDGRAVAKMHTPIDDTTIRLVIVARVPSQYVASSPRDGPAPEGCAGKETVVGATRKANNPVGREAKHIASRHQGYASIPSNRQDGPPGLQGIQFRY
jgi:hypothetical protein